MHWASLVPSPHPFYFTVVQYLSTVAGISPQYLQCYPCQSTNQPLSTTIQVGASDVDMACSGGARHAMSCHVIVG